MNEVIRNILKKENYTKEEKDKALNELADDIEMAKGILSGKFLHCPDCDDYYLAKSFLRETETKETQICVYEDWINSGGNEYEDGFLDITYSICPKGHRHEITRNERKKIKRV